MALQFFDVPEQAAEDYAALQVALASDHGSPEKAARLDWIYHVKKDGSSNKWPWRSEDERIQFEAAQRQKYQAYEVLISKRPS